MRTTITIDDDVASKLRPIIAREKGKSKKVINDLLRKALGIKRARKIELPVFNMGIMPGIDQTSFNKLADELEADEYLERFGK